jgi:rSAM/selenodomain-associated transferase 2
VGVEHVAVSIAKKENAENSRTRFPNGAGFCYFPGTMISIIIPTLNEAQVIGKTLDVVTGLHGRMEIIVADGGSADDTVAIARRRGAHVLEGRGGRGLLMHAGASQAQGEVLWFLHADTHPAVDALEHILDALRRPDVVGGHFVVWFNGRRRAARFLTLLYAHLHRFGFCYGDSALFVRRNIYEAVGGFRPFPLFEDLDLVRRLQERGRFPCIPSRVVVSSRRFEEHSFTATFARWVALQFLFWLGIPPPMLGNLYPPVRGKSRKK